MDISRFALAQQSTQFVRGFFSPLELKKWLQENNPPKGIAFIGRSNVGKSSLINSLFGRGTARTSNTPGRTREINLFQFKLFDLQEKKELGPFLFFDLPGYGHAKVSKEMLSNWQELMQTFFSLIPADNLLLNLQDARHPMQKSDLLFKDLLTHYPGKSFLIFNKIDKLKNQKERAQLDKLKPEIYQTYKNVEQIHFVSAETKKGIENLYYAICFHLLN